MEPNFEAFQLIGQIALGIIGFSAILIGLSRTSEGFSAPDNFRVQLLTYSAFGAMFGSVIPFAIFSGNNFDVAADLFLDYERLRCYGADHFSKKNAASSIIGIQRYFSNKIVFISDRNPCARICSVVNDDH